MEAKVDSRSLPKPAGRHVRSAGFAVVLAGALFAVSLAEPLLGATTSLAATAERHAGPLWVGAGDDRAALRLIDLLETSAIDGLDPRQFKIKALKRAVRAADSGSGDKAAKANAMLDKALVAYAA